MLSDFSSDFLDNTLPSPFKLSRKSFTDLCPYFCAKGASIPVGRFPSLARQNEQLHTPLQTGQCQLGSFKARTASSPYLENILISYDPECKKLVIILKKNAVNQITLKKPYFNDILNFMQSLFYMKSLIISLHQINYFLLLILTIQVRVNPLSFIF